MHTHIIVVVFCCCLFLIAALFHKAYMSLQICVNWFDFFDPESGISKYRVGIGREPGKTDIIKLTEISGKQHSTCLILGQDIQLEHGKIYFAVVWAYNGAINQRNTSAISNGGNTMQHWLLYFGDYLML